MPKIIAFHSFRRSTGKSSLAANTAVICAQQGMRVGLVDLNLESPSLAYTFQLEGQSIPYRINDFLWQNCTIDQAAYDITKHLETIWHTNISGRLTLVPANTQYSDNSHTLKDAYDIKTLNEGLLDLSLAIQPDLLILDTHAGINDDAVFALAVSDVLLILLRPDRQDYQGTAVIVDIARGLEVPQVGLIVNDVPNRFDPADVQREVEAGFGCNVAAVIPFSTDMVGMEHPRVLALEDPQHPIINTLREMISPYISL